MAAAGRQPFYRHRNWAAFPAALAGPETDLIATVPERPPARAPTCMALRCLPGTGDYRVNAGIPAHGGDAAHLWLRGCVLDLRSSPACHGYAYFVALAAKAVEPLVQLGQRLGDVGAAILNPLACSLNARALSFLIRSISAGCGPPMVARFFTVIRGPASGEFHLAHPAVPWRTWSLSWHPRQMRRACSYGSPAADVVGFRVGDHF